MAEQTTRRLNRYTCDACGAFIITVDADEGTTPFMLGMCKATEGCPGPMESSFYQNVSGTPTYVWRKPTDAEYQTSSPDMKRHYDQGGLNIYPIQ